MPLSLLPLMQWFANAFLTFLLINFRSFYPPITVYFFAYLPLNLQKVMVSFVLLKFVHHREIELFPVII